MNFVTSGATGYEFPNVGEGGNRFGVLRREANHLCRIEVLGNTVRFQAIDERSVVMDEWEEPSQRLLNREPSSEEDGDAVPEA